MNSHRKDETPSPVKSILGLSCFYHDSAAAIIQNGEILAAAQEERFTRQKHDASLLSFSGSRSHEPNKITPFLDKNLW